MEPLFCFSRRCSKTSREAWLSLLRSHCSALCPRVHETLPEVTCLFPPVLWSSCAEVLLAFKARCSGGSSS